mmetsp:Transcript_358/g.546  ORF Transcript_358/g.546 Transcript_358/m.546 type:complete len:85 (-) Transcript_358:235-489(-)
MLCLYSQSKSVLDKLLSDSKQSPLFSLYNSAVVVFGAERIGEKVERNLCPPVDALDRCFLADGVVVAIVEMLRSAGGFRWTISL